MFRMRARLFQNATAACIAILFAGCDRREEPAFSATTTGTETAIAEVRSRMSAELPEPEAVSSRPVPIYSQGRGAPDRQVLPGMS